MCSGRGKPRWTFTGGCCSEGPIRTREGAEGDVYKSLKLSINVNPGDDDHRARLDSVGASDAPEKKSEGVAPLGPG